MNAIEKGRAEAVQILQSSEKDVLLVQFKSGEVPQPETIFSFFNRLGGMKSLYLFSPSLSEAGRGAFYREGDAGQGSTVDVEPPKPPPATVGPEEYRAALMFNLPPEYVEAFDKRIAAASQAVDPVAKLGKRKHSENIVPAESLPAPAKKSKKEKKRKVEKPAPATVDEAPESAETSTIASIPPDPLAPSREVTELETLAQPAIISDEAKAARKAEKKAKKAAAKSKSALILDYDQRAYSPSVFDPSLHIGVVDDHSPQVVEQPPAKVDNVEPPEESQKKKGKKKKKHASDPGPSEPTGDMDMERPANPIPQDDPPPPPPPEMAVPNVVTDGSPPLADAPKKKKKRKHPMEESTLPAEMSGAPSTATDTPVSLDKVRETNGVTEDALPLSDPPKKKKKRKHAAEEAVLPPETNGVPLPTEDDFIPLQESGERRKKKKKDRAVKEAKSAVELDQEIAIESTPPDVPKAKKKKKRRAVIEEGTA